MTPTPHFAWVSHAQGKEKNEEAPFEAPPLLAKIRGNARPPGECPPPGTAQIFLKKKKKKKKSGPREGNPKVPKPKGNPLIFKTGPPPRGEPLPFFFPFYGRG
eukprot:FR744292.1.p2 GENE.FR744292.1~~FR744292.1.p2  ORF type:complete len:103 (+),score=64.49 FR744292.1:801-1109(+)